MNGIDEIISAAIRVAESYVGEKETAPNRSIRIDNLQKEFGFIGLPYCVIFCLYCYKKACEQLHVRLPILITPSSQSLFEWAKKREYIYTNPQLIKPGDIVIWRRWKLWSGHAGLTVSFLKIKNETKLFETIEGNTSNSDYGNQRDGDGIYRRIRYANKIDFDVDGFYLRGFIDIRKVFTQ